MASLDALACRPEIAAQITARRQETCGLGSAASPNSTSSPWPSSTKPLPARVPAASAWASPNAWSDPAPPYRQPSPARPCPRTGISLVATFRLHQAGSPDQLQSQHGTGGAGDLDQSRGAGQGAAALELGDERRRRPHPGGQLGLGEPGIGTRLQDRPRDLQGRIKVVQGTTNAHAQAALGSAVPIPDHSRNGLPSTTVKGRSPKT